MKFLVIAIWIAAIFTVGSAATENSRPDVADAVTTELAKMAKTHPRLLVGHGGSAALLKNADRDEGKALRERIFHEADRLLDVKPIPRRMIGHRMLDASRDVLFRVNMLGMAYLLSGDRKYAEAGIRECVHAAGYADWNPKHFLDTAEMTLALAIGYDWFYQLMTSEQRELVRRAIVDKGLLEAFKHKRGWVLATNNWSQVCHAGMVAGALAVAEDYPELAAQTIRRALAAMPRTMNDCYAPNGAYSEGPLYWSYGTEFNVVLLAVFDSVFGHDFGLSKQPGFDRTLDFTDATMTPSGFTYTYADSFQNKSAYFSLARIWLIRKFNRPDCFSGWFRSLYLANAKLRPRGLWHDSRLLPLMMFFLTDYPTETSGENQPFSYDSGRTALIPIAIHRTGSDRRAVYLGIKGGFASAPHAHMDGGSFLIEADGVRWASDLGMENYSRQEAAGVDIWTRNRQDSGRWNVFRLGPRSHNILMIDDHSQLIHGKAQIVEFKGVGKGQSSTLDLTPLYAGDLRQAIRRAELLPSREIVITDHLTGLKPGAKVRWQMYTQTEVAEVDGKVMRLSSGPETLQLAVTTSARVCWNVIPDERLRSPTDTPNPNGKLLLFELMTPTDGTLEIAVRFTPGSANR